VVRDVIVADAARYYGAVRLAEDADVTDLSCRVESIFTRLVPSAQTEIPLVDRPLAGEVQPVVASANGTVTTSRTASMAPGGLYVLPTGCWPGSLALTIAGHALSDDSLGNVIRAGVTIGRLNYATGEIAFNRSAPTARGATTEPTARPPGSLSRPTPPAARSPMPPGLTTGWCLCCPCRLPEPLRWPTWPRAAGICCGTTARA